MMEISDVASRITAALIGAGYIKRASGETPPAAKEAAVKDAADLFEIVLKELRGREF
jgi:hypothetical protein